MCLMDAMTICVLYYEGLIEMMSIGSTDMSRDIKTTRSLRLKGVLDGYHGVVRFHDNLLVTGRKHGRMYWCIVSLDDGHVDTIHRICKGYECSVATKDNMVYISCCSGDESPENGVYGFDILNPSQCKYKYKHQRLQLPSSIVINEDGNIFVRNIGFPPCIHQLTASCQLVTIFTRGIPLGLYAIFWDNGRLYATRMGTSDITVFQPVYQGIPIEILKMDDRSIQLFEEALKAGKENVYNIRVMVVGHVGVGKTTLIKRLIGEEVDISERQSTEGVDVHVNCCDVSLSSLKWIQRKKDSEQDHRLRCLAKVLIEQHSTSDKAIDEEQAAVLPQGVGTDNSANVTDKEPVVVPLEEAGILNSHTGAHVSVEDKETEALSTGSHSPRQDFGQNIVLPAGQGKEFPSAIAQTTLTQSETSTMAMLKLLKENPDKLGRDAVKYAPMTIWDFAGQYTFYTTHQTFLTRRAIYLLVLDVSGQITDLVDDECYFDSEGIMKCRVHDLIEVWINSIHSCAPSSEAGIPTVILVGTHVDKISQKESPAEGIESETYTMMSDTDELTLPTTLPPAAASKEQAIVSSTILPMQSIADLNTEEVDTEDERSKGNVEGWESSDTEYDLDTEDTADSESRNIEDVEAEKYRHEICEKYFRQIRSYLRDKPTRFHLVNEDFAINNTIVDRKLKDLKRKIIEVASSQTYWGEEIPSRWILLEQELMRLRAAGIKVIPLSLLEDLNKAGAVQISTDELDLFLRYQHDIGAVLYFSTEVLKMKIVLDPQWMIDALKSLITAEMFVLRNTPAVSKKWFEFKENGKLSPELIDAIWTKQNKPDLHDNRDYILHLLEEMNIVAKPKIYGEDALEVKEENYFLAPCMLHQETPEEVICPKPNPQMETSSVLCYVFAEKYLPSPIFHRLLAACVARWPLATKKKDKEQENQIFCGCGVFQLDQFHKLILHFREYVIFLRVIRMGIKEKTPSSEVCIGAREFISAMLSKIIGYLSQNLRYEYFIQCPEYNGVSVNSLIPVSLLEDNSEVRCDFHDHMIESCNVLKFWFKDQDQSGYVTACSVCYEEVKTEMDMEDGKEKGYILEEDLSNLRLEDYATKEKVKQQEIGGTLFGSSPATQAAGTGSGTSEKTTGKNFTVEDLFEHWPSVEDYILEELAPRIILPFFEKEGLLSSEEYEQMLKLGRRQMAEKLLQRIKAQLPEAFSSLFHALNETEQVLIVQGLRQQIERPHGPQPMTHGQETNAVVTSIVYYTLTLEMLKDGNILNEAESKTRAYLDKCHIIFDHCMRSRCLAWKVGSIIICLKPLGSLTREGLRFFCVHNGIKNFVSDLLKRKIIFSSLPEGEMIVHVQVHCYNEDPHFEGADGQNRDYTQLNVQASFTVTDNPEMIKNNLSLQYDIFLEEIDPLLFKDTFVSREILDKVFFEGLGSIDQRRERAAHFLGTIMDKGNEALAALVLALRESGLDKLANNLCTIQESSSRLGDEGQVDSASTEVVQMDWTTHPQEPMLCSCRMNVTVRKNEDVSTIPSPADVVMHAPSSGSTASTMAGPIECQTSSSTADALVQAPKHGSTTANGMQAPASRFTTGVSCSDPELLCQVLKKSTQVASSSRRTLEENCQRAGLKFHGETPGNGNCFFEAVSSQLHRLNCSVQKSPQQLRQDVVAFMKANTILQGAEGTINLAEFISVGNFDDYCERMARDGEWADHVVVVGMARMLQTDIMIVTSAPSSGPDNIIAWVVGQTNFNGQPFLLGHIWECHYQSLQPMDHEAHEVQQSNEGKQPVREETATQTEQEAEHSEDGSYAGPMQSPPTSDTDRFMCIAYLLNDVGSKVLRKLFHHMVITPTCTLDQHLANNRSTIDSLLKKRVLNQSQMNIMFPPNGDDTNLDDYDITLLSALFNNIVPSLGHQEMNLVKGLREDRNKLYGHTKSCTMNANDFQKCWSNISSALITLSQQCGDPNFENEMLKEIQQTRVPDISYLSILQAWFSRIERVEQRLESSETSPTSEPKT